MITTGPHDLMEQIGSPSVDPFDERLRRAVLFHLDGQFDLALDLYEQLLAEHPNHPAALNNAALIALERDDPGGAIDRLAHLEEVSTTATITLAHAHLRAGDIDRALGLLEHAVAQDLRSHAWAPLGEARLFVGDLAGALVAFSVAVELLPARSELWRHLGTCLAGSDRVTEAIRAFERSVELDPSDASAWRQLGLCFLARHDVGSAVESLTCSVDLDPDAPGARRDLASALLIVGETSDAAQQLELAAEAGDAVARVDRAIVCLAENDPTSALEWLSSVPREGDETGRLALYEAYAHLALGNEDEGARRLRDVAGSDGPFREQAVEALGLVDSLDRPH
jgi:Tfp pilus assembly protein PilF